jgi:hypothetical protein
MWHEADERLVELLVRVRACRRTAHKVEYSREDERTLWDGGDRVEHAEGAKQYGFYVTLHHFNGEIIGQHVALAPADVVKFCGGEKHVYRLRRGSGPREHLSVYVYNPSVNANGPLRFEVRTTARCRGLSRADWRWPRTCVRRCCGSGARAWRRGTRRCCGGSSSSTRSCCISGSLGRVSGCRGRRAACSAASCGWT